MNKQLSFILISLLVPFFSNGQIDCGWTDSTETESSSSYLPESVSDCVNPNDSKGIAYIPAANDTLAVLNIMAIIVQDTAGNSLFYDDHFKDSSFIHNMVHDVSVASYGNVPAPNIPNPFPTVNMSDTRIRFNFTGLEYVKKSKTHNNVRSELDIIANLPASRTDSTMILVYSHHEISESADVGRRGEAGAYTVIFWDHDTNWHAGLMAHELGHCLGLRHTFYVNPWVNGDGLSDTPLDAYVTSANGCAPLPQGCGCPPSTPYPGNICPENYMGYNSRKYWSPIQAGVMRRTAILERKKALQYQVTPPVQVGIPAQGWLDIVNHEVWTSSRTLQTNVRVKSGASLTISGSVGMPVEGVIEGEAGAELILDCGYLYGEGGFWTGIRLLGDNTLEQSPQNQGKLTMDNSLISTATDAVFNGTLHNCAVSPSGGIIEVSNSTFYNNLRDVALVKYDRGTGTGHWLADWVDYKATFTNTVFEKQGDFNPDSLYRGAAVSLWGVHGVVFDQCSFIMEAGLRGQTHMPGDAIYMLDATASITSGEIRYFTYGIRSYTTKPVFRGSQVHQMRMANNRYGVLFSGGHRHSILDNRFWVPKDIPATLGNGAYDLPYGIYMNHAGMFRIEENRILASTASPDHYSTAPTATHIALGINENGDFSDLVYNNSFNNGQNAIQASGQNRDGTGLNGLQCRCNVIAAKTGIYVRGTLNNSLDGVRLNQGNGVLNPEQEDMAGNLFANTPGKVWAFLNEYTPNINYHHHDKATNALVEPAPRQGVLTFGYQGLNYNGMSCPTKLMVLPEGDTLMETDYPFAVAEIDFADYSGKSDSLRTLLDNLVDGGNTWQLQAEIYFTPQHEYYELYLDMMNEAPYLSRSVLSDLIALDGFDDMMLRNVLVAHPQSAKDAALMDQLATDHPAMPQYMVDDIMAGQDQFGTKEVMEGTLSAYRQNQFSAAHRLLDIYTGDPAYSEEALTAVRSIFDAMPFAGFQYMRVQMELELGNISLAQTVLDNIPNIVVMNDDESARHNQVVGYFDIQMDMAENGLQWCDVDETVLTGLQGMSGANHAAGAWARAALTLREQTVSYREPLYLPGTDQGKRSSEHQYPQVERPATRIYPNPTRGIVTVDLGEIPLDKGLTLTVHDLNGKAVKTLNLKGQSTVIDLRNLPAGVYVLSVRADANRIFEDKLVLFD